MISEDIEEQPPESPKGTQEDGTTCMFCMEEWTIGSEHRICCLKCGHLFGRSCIERWIKEKGATAKCPTCNKPAKRVDLRDLWCKSLKATDNTEICQLQQELERERKLRHGDAATIYHQNMKIEMLHEDLSKMKKGVFEKDEKIRKMQTVLDRYNQLRAQKLAGTNTIDTFEEESADSEGIDIVFDASIAPRELKGQFHFAENIESSANGGCRSFALCPTSCLILVAQPSPQGAGSVFGGFGLRKYSIMDTSIREFIPLHSKMITSIQLKPVGDLVLTSSMDKRVRLTSTSNNTCIQSFPCDYEPTCVSWSAHRDQQFYVASGNCFVTLYDIRNTSEYIYQTCRKVANTRILSIVSTTNQEGVNGLLVNDSRGCQYLEISDSSGYELETIDRSLEHLTSHQLPFDGLMGTVDFNKKLDIALISTRRSPMTQNFAHHLIKLKKFQEDDGNTKIECQRIKTFLGGRSAELLSQSRILKHPTMSEGVLICASDEDARGIKMWDSSDNTEYQTIKTDSFIRDMIMYNPENTNQHILYTLSEKGLNVYRWDYA